MKITPRELQQIIKEEAIRLKKRMMLEAEKATILKKLQEMEECDMMEDAPMGAPVEGEVVIKPNVEAAIDKNAQMVLSKLSPEQIEKAKAELAAAGLLGASDDEIEAKVKQMLPMNESMMNEAWDKSKIYNWLVGGGLGAVAAGLTTTVLGSLPTQELSNLADYTGGTVTPTAGVIIGLIVAALGAISVASGMKGHNTLAAEKSKISPEQAAAIIARRKATHGR